jgi:breakpoint cluster region protein
MEAGEQRIQMCRHILTSILESESIYLECLSVCLQYMKAMKVTLTTPSPVIPKEDFDVIFYKVPELYEFHHHFHDRQGEYRCF